MKSFRYMFTAKQAMLCLAVLLLSSCAKKKDSDSATPAVEKGTLYLHIHTYFGDAEIQLAGIPEVTSDGIQVSMDKAQTYISDVQLVKLDGIVHNVPVRRLLKVIENDLYSLGEVPVGNYHTIRFKVGLDASTNAMPPSASSDSALLNKPEMWFGSAAQPDGYVFLLAEGKMDTSSSHSEAPVPFLYKIGTNANYRQVSVSGINLTIVKGQPEITHLVADYRKLLSGVALNVSSNLSVTTAAANGMAPAIIIADSIPVMFRTE